MGRNQKVKITIRYGRDVELKWGGQLSAIRKLIGLIIGLGAAGVGAIKAWFGG